MERVDRFVSVISEDIFFSLGQVFVLHQGRTKRVPFITRMARLQSGADLHNSGLDRDTAVIERGGCEMDPFNQLKKKKKNPQRTVTSLIEKF